MTLLSTNKLERAAERTTALGVCAARNQELCVYSMDPLNFEVESVKVTKISKERDKAYFKTWMEQAHLTTGNIRSKSERNLRTLTFQNCCERSKQFKLSFAYSR